MKSIAFNKQALNLADEELGLIFKSIVRSIAIVAAYLYAAGMFTAGYLKATYQYAQELNERFETWVDKWVDYPQYELATVTTEK